MRFSCEDMYQKVPALYDEEPPAKSAVDRADVSASDAGERLGIWGAELFDLEKIRDGTAPCSGWKEKA